MSDTYGVNPHEGEDDVLILASVVVIDTRLDWPRQRLTS